MSSRHSEKHHSRHDKESKDRDRDRKRKDRENESSHEHKKKKIDTEVTSEVKVESMLPSGIMTAEQIRNMMNEAKKTITQRKVDLNIKTPFGGGLAAELLEKSMKSAELSARIQASLAQNAAILQTGGLVKQISSSAAKPGALILDDLGRTIDAATGEVIEINRSYAPTLKANIRAKRREQFKTAIEKPPEEISDSKFFDPRVSLRTVGRSKRAFKFHEKGKFESLAQKLRAKAQLERLQNEISQAAKKTGIASAAKLASILPKKELQEGEVPDHEWWDSYIMGGQSYEDFLQIDESTPLALLKKYEEITTLVEHPIQIKPPAVSEKPVVIPIMLTKQERKKLRRQNRAETQKEMTEKIRLGLIPPPEPKVRMANLMRVLGTDAVQDPTKVEAHVRAQMAKRQKAHEEANAARKLTPEQRKEKKAKKLQEDTSTGVHVTVFRVSDLHDPAKKFKIEMNAKQLYMTGLVVMFKDCNCIVMEGGPKQQKKFKHLMLQRIKWTVSKDKANADENDDENSEDEETAKKANKCVLVWEGEVPQRSFADVRFKICPTEAFAREQFKRNGVEHYWNLAYSASILEATGQDLM